MPNDVNNATEDFLSDIGETEFFDGKLQETNSEPIVVSENKPVAKLVLSETTDSSPELVGSDFPQEYLHIVERIKAQYKLLPAINYDTTYKEIGELSVRSVPTPTLEILNDELHKVQAYKDRLSEILIDVIKCYNFKKRAVDILKDAWGKFSSEKNAESRKGDATFRLSLFLTDFAQTEALSKSCDHILKNLDSLQDNLSRRITIWQMLLKVREGRMALPDYDFDKELSGAKLDDLFENKDDKSENENSGVKLREF